MQVKSKQAQGRFRIAIATEQLDNIKSGIGLHARLLSQGLAGAGHEVHIFCPREKGTSSDAGFGPTRNESAGKIHEHRVKQVRHDLAHANWLILSRRLNRMLDSVELRLAQDTGKGFDIIHFTDARVALFSRRRDRKKTIMLGNMNDFYFAASDKNPLNFRKDYDDWIPRYTYYHLTKRLESRALEKLDAIICNTRYVREQLTQAYPRITGRLHVIYKAVDSRGYDKKTSLKESRLQTGDKTEKIILFIGGNYQRKGLPLIIRAMPAIIEKVPSARLVVIGKDKAESAMRRIAKSAGLGKSVSFLSWQPHEVAQKYLDRASLFAMPSLMEAFGVVYLEAMAAGVPVIGSKIGGTKEMIEDGRNGFLADPRDVGEFARKAILLLKDEGLRKRFIFEGRKTVKRFSAERMVRETEALYSKILRMNRA